ncbi:two component regulator [Nitzschia inconspicua]|uniref:Two component regulator n=1 Tax=Nitzschia inconspicua TaxID=303405 RepID=A0A9K3LZP2_9STRA|nr:two component regulator [Nitzschia inconspicua]
MTTPSSTHHISASSKTGMQQQQQHLYTDRPTMECFDVDVDVNEDAEMEEIAVHDQLPTVEEIKAKVVLDSTNAAARRQRNQRQFLVFLSLALLCAISLIGLIWIGIKRQRTYDSRVAVTQTVRISHLDVLSDSSSPQSRALYWMTHQDPLRLPLPTKKTDPFVQRYIVATLVFAVVPSHRLTEFKSKFSILSAQHECLWNSQWKRAGEEDPVEATRLGIICEDNDGQKVESEEEGMREQGHDNDEVQAVTAIIWPSLEMQGELPPELESLKSLKYFNMDNNQIVGSIPVLPRLRHLSLAYNALTGYLPQHIFSEMTRLETLNLAENALQGSLPKNFAALTNLKVLALKGNQLTAGLEQIYQLSSLEELYMSYNSLNEQFSNGSFQDLKNLKVLDMKNNRLAGPLPDALWALSRLEVVDFHQNALDGHINDAIIPNHPLKFLDVSTNILGGGLPPSVSNLRHLTHLDVSYNRFQVTLPNYLANMTKIQTLILTENDMFGPNPLPQWLRGMTDLKHLSFRLTSRTGTIPTWFGELTKLELLDLDWNHISGTIPSELGRLDRLKYLMLNRNLMNGKIPVQVSSLPNLNALMVDNNGFTGELDACHVSFMIADCGDPDKGCPDCGSDTQRIACPCCTTCCYDYDERCNMQDHVIEFEDEFRGAYGQYSFDAEKVEYELSA